MSSISRSVKQIARVCYFYNKLSRPANKIRLIHSSCVCNRDVTTINAQKELVVSSEGLFNEVKKKSMNKVAFQSAIKSYITKESLYRRGHVEFIYAALSNMKEFGVARDLSVYKEILQIFPEERFIPKSVWQVEFMHYPRQQQCAIDVMEQMEDNGVVPDREFGAMLKCVFGVDAHAFRKYRRIMYWLPKFRNANPYPVPWELPDDAIELAVLALRRMSVDLDNTIKVWKTVNMEIKPVEDTFIVSAQSSYQQDLLRKHPQEKALFVEGGYTVWLRERSQKYFILRADSSLPNSATIEKEDDADFNWTCFEEESSRDLAPLRTVHEQDDGTVLAMCITGTSTKDSLVTWIRYMQKANPSLEETPIVFSLQTPIAELEPFKPDTKTEVLSPNPLS